MNYSPMNDPGFNKKREEERKKAASKRRKTMMIILISATLLGVLCVTLLGMALVDAFPQIKDLFKDDPQSIQSLPSIPPVVSKPSSGLPSPVSTPGSVLSPTPSPPPVVSSPSVSDPNIRVTTIYIDAGHGYTNSYGAPDVGAGEGSVYHQLSGGLYEADLNLSIAQKVKQILLDNGYKVVMSRESYVNEPLKITQRAINAVATGADCIVSIHANSALQSAKGTRVYYCERLESSVMGKRLAQRIADAVEDDTGLSGRGVLLYEDHNVGNKDGAGYVMCNSTGNIPSTLIETCFLTNEEDAQKAVTEEWQNRMAAAIAKGIMQTFECKTTFVP